MNMDKDDFPMDDFPMDDFPIKRSINWYFVGAITFSFLIDIGIGLSIYAFICLFL